MADLAHFHVRSCRAVFYHSVVWLSQYLSINVHVFFLKGKKKLFHSDRQTTKLLQTHLRHYGIQIYDLEEQKWTVELKWQRDTQLVHSSGFDSSVVLMQIEAHLLKHLTWTSHPVSDLVLLDPYRSLNKRCLSVFHLPVCAKTQRCDVTAIAIKCTSHV